MVDQPDDDAPDYIFCNEDKARSNEARNMMVLAVIKHYFWKNGILGNMAILSDNSFSSMAWTWDQQGEWMGSCKDGKTQSPIALKDSEAVLTDKMRIIPKWSSLSVPVARFDGHETVVTGDFGQTVFQLGGRTKVFNAKEVRFKFPSEHMLGDRKMDGEMQIYHRSNNGGEAIVSVFLKSGSDGSTDHNLFIENLEVEGWKLATGKPYRCDARPDISQIVKGGVTAYFQKTFYYYKGSMTTPPCNPGIDRFVFKETIVLPSTQFNNLKSKTFNPEEEPQGNARHAKKNEGIMVYYHIDKSVNCKLASNKILEAAEEEVARMESEKEGKSYQGKFIKAKTTLNTYGAMFGGDFPAINDPDRGVAIDTVSEGDVPVSVREKLGKEEYERVMKYSKEVLAEKGFDSKKVKIQTASAWDTS